MFSTQAGDGFKRTVCCHGDGSMSIINTDTVNLCTFAPVDSGEAVIIFPSVIFFTLTCLKLTQVLLSFT